MTGRPVIHGLVPVRIGSRRVKAKNLRLVGGRPLMAWVVDAVLAADCFDRTCVNSDSPLVGRVAERLGIGFHRRPAELATSESMIDEYLYEYMTAEPDCDVLAVVNPTSPFLTAADVERAVADFLDSGVDTLLACEAVRTHCFLDGKAINFSTDGQHPRSQDLEPVMALNFAVTVWNTRAARAQYEDKGHLVYTGRLGFHEFEGLAALDLDWEEDFVLADMILRNREAFEDPVIEYDPVLDDLVDEGRLDELQS